MKYPLISKLNLYFFRNAGRDYVFAEELEQLLQKSTVVYGWYVPNLKEGTWTSSETTKPDTHKALLLAIEPIEQKTVTITLQTINDLVGKFLNDDSENDRGDFSQYIIKELAL